MYDGKMFVFGGRDKSDILSQLLCFDLTTKNWSIVKDGTTPAREGVCIVARRSLEVGQGVVLQPINVSPHISTGCSLLLPNSRNHVLLLRKSELLANHS